MCLCVPPCFILMENNESDIAHFYSVRVSLFITLLLPPSIRPILEVYHMVLLFLHS